MMMLLQRPRRSSLWSRVVNARHIRFDMECHIWFDVYMYTANTSVDCALIFRQRAEQIEISGWAAREAQWQELGGKCDPVNVTACVANKFEFGAGPQPQLQRRIWLGWQQLMKTDVRPSTKCTCSVPSLFNIFVNSHVNICSHKSRLQSILIFFRRYSVQENL